MQHPQTMRTLALVMPLALMILVLGYFGILPTRGIAVIDSSACPLRQPTATPAYETAVLTSLARHPTRPPLAENAMSNEQLLYSLFGKYGRLIAYGNSGAPGDRVSLRSYCLEEVVLPKMLQLQVYQWRSGYDSPAAQTKISVQRYWLLSVEGPFGVYSHISYIHIGNVTVGSAGPDPSVALIFDRSILKEGATINVDGADLPVKLHFLPGEGW